MNWKDEWIFKDINENISREVFNHQSFIKIVTSSLEIILKEGEYDNYVPEIVLEESGNYISVKFKWDDINSYLPFEIILVSYRNENFYRALYYLYTIDFSNNWSLFTNSSGLPKIETLDEVDIDLDSFINMFSDGFMEFLYRNFKPTLYNLNCAYSI